MNPGANKQFDTTPEHWSDQEISEWFRLGKWKQEWKAMADETLNQKEFAIQYFRNPGKWDKAFAFLREENLCGLEKGRYELDGILAYVLVDEYMPRKEEDSRFEAHRKYADIQYVASGQEFIGITPLGNTRVTVAYSEEKDIVFLAADGNNLRPASPDRFFILFPGDAHMPCIQSEKDTKVKKIVIKILLE